MKATIYHNPRCSTSRRTLDLLRQAGADVAIVEYLKEPLSVVALTRLLERAGLRPREGLRAKEPLARELGLAEGEAGDAAILEAMSAHPILIERPFVETEKGVRLCRPPERALEIL